MRTLRSSCLRRSKGSHNTYALELATVRYRWHPLYGQALRVHRRMTDCRGEHIFVELGDGTICSLPVWMFSPDCTVKCSLGPPLIAIEALKSLQDLLSVRQLKGSCDTPSLNPPSKERGSEEGNSSARDAAKPRVSKRNTIKPAGKQGKRIGTRARRTATQQLSRKRRQTNRRRRR